MIVSYINTSVEVKAESDILCTSRNAVKVVNSIPADKPVLFLPDINLGNYVREQTGRANMKIWQGACIVHATFAARKLLAARSEHPSALVAAHPECPADVLQMADFIGSTSAIVDWCATQEANEFIVMTESGVRYSLEKMSPGKTFHFLPNEQCNCSECPYMKRNTLEKLRDALRDLEPRVELSADTDRARPAADRQNAGDSMTPLIDTFGRLHDNLRISVTDRCNIRCFYCMPEVGVKFQPRDQILSFEEIERFVRVAVSLGVRKLRHHRRRAIGAQRRREADQQAGGDRRH